MGPVSGGPLISRGPRASGVSHFPLLQAERSSCCLITNKGQWKGQLHPPLPAHTCRKSGNLKLFMLWILSTVRYQRSAAEQWGRLFVIVCWMLHSRLLFSCQHTKDEEEKLFEKDIIIFFLIICFYFSVPNWFSQSILESWHWITLTHAQAVVFVCHHVEKGHVLGKPWSDMGLSQLCGRRGMPVD